MRARFFLAAVLTLGSFGCVRRTIVAFEDHPTQPMTSMQIVEIRSYIFSTSVEHQFLSCTDTDKELVCKRQCGGSTDLECPQANSNWHHTNVR